MIEINNEGDNITPLFKVRKTENIALIKYFVEQGTDINKKRYEGETPIFSICRSGNETLIKYLAQHRADINKIDIL